VNCKNGVSSWEIHRAIGVTQKTAWFMLQRGRLAMQSRTGGKLGGEIEVDETFIGARSRNMHADKRAEKIHGRGPEGKVIVAAVRARHGEVRPAVMENRRKKALQELVRETGETGSNQLKRGLKGTYVSVEPFHLFRYVDEQAKRQGRGRRISASS
jgi:hypothetical protein